MDDNVSDKASAKRLKKKILDEVDRYNTPGSIDDEVAFSGEYIISFSMDNDSTM